MNPAGAVMALALGAAQPPEGAPLQPPAAVQPAPAQPESDTPTEPLADDAKGVSVDQAYQAAERHQGPLDGSWRLSDNAGVPLFDFQLTDPGGAPSPRATQPDHPEIEGAWRDLRREGAMVASGFLQSVRRDGTSLEIQFVESDPARPTRLLLRASLYGGWAGELDEAAGPPVVVFLERQ